MSKKDPPMIGVSPPIEGEAGQTGTWRSQRPVIDQATCVTCGAKPRHCQMCWMYCPEVAITQGKPPIIDYRYCKGCGICAHECPSGAITMRPEAEDQGG